MAIRTYVEDGMLVGYLPTCGASARVPIREILREAQAISGLTDDEIGALDEYSGDTIVGALDEVGAGKIRRKLKKAIKKVAKNKIVKALAKVVKRAVPPPFSVAVTAAAGAAKFAKALKSRKTRAKAKKMLPAVRAAAAGRISPKRLTAIARKNRVKPSIAADAAVIKRVAMQSRTNPQAAATMALAKDLTSTQPMAQARAAAALESQYHEPTTSRDSGEGEGLEPEPMYEEAEPMDDQAPMTEDSMGPEEVEPYEADDGSYSEDAMQDSVEGFGYF
jgi:hypothetical protein